jgi:hypothetical protein
MSFYSVGFNQNKCAFHYHELLQRTPLLNIPQFLARMNKQILDSDPDYIRLVKETEICQNCKNIVIGKEIQMQKFFSLVKLPEETKTSKANRLSELPEKILTDCSRKSASPSTMYT